MPYAFVQQAQFSENRGTATSASIATGAFGASLTAGNLMLAVVCYFLSPDDGPRTVTLSGAGSPTWNEESVFNDGAGNYFHWFYAMNVPGGTTTQLTASFNGTVAFPAIFSAEYSGFKTSGARLAAVSNTQSTPTTSTDAVTSGLLGTLAAQPAGIIGFSFNTAGLATPAAGTSFTGRTAVWTYEGATPTVARLEDRRVTATTSVAATFTAGNNSTHQTIAWAFEESAGAPATLSSATPSGTLGTQTTATLGATTDQTTGTFYGVVDTAGNISGITAAQIKAGQNNASASAIAASNSAVSNTTPSTGVSGLTASTLYSYAVVQNNSNGDSNVLTGTFTTADPAPPPTNGLIVRIVRRRPH